MVELPDNRVGRNSETQRAHLLGLADLPDDTGSAWPKFSTYGRWQQTAANPFDVAKPVANFLNPARLPVDWEASVNRQIERIAAFCGPNLGGSLDQQKYQVAARRKRIGRLFGSSVAKRTVVLALAPPELFLAEAERRHFRQVGDDHGRLLEQLVFDFLRRQLPERRFHARYRASLSRATLGLAADYRLWLTALKLDIQLLTLILPFAGYSISAVRTELVRPGCEHRCLVPAGMFVLAQLAAQLPDIINGRTLAAAGDIFRPDGKPEDASRSLNLHLDADSVHIEPNDCWLADPDASSVLIVL